MYLLDTHALVWAVAAPEELPAKVRKLLATEQITASVVSYWELILKKRRANSPVLDPAAWWHRYIRKPQSKPRRSGLPTSIAWTH
jgi:PIN domain nuclease of toxin-antitoxin system